MQILRFIVTVAFAWMLVRTTFANTVQWRHPHASVSATVRREPREVRGQRSLRSATLAGTADSAATVR